LRRDFYSRVASSAAASRLLPRLLDQIGDHLVLNLNQELADLRLLLNSAMARALSIIPAPTMPVRLRVAIQSLCHQLSALLQR